MSAAPQLGPGRSEQVRIRSGGIDLAGTLTLPRRGGPHPAVLLLPGSGQTDRDDNARRLAINLFPPIVAALDERGLSTLRYDKRGVGASPGDHWSVGFDDLLADAAAAVSWLRDRSEVDPARTFVLGHSEGALLATRLAGGGTQVAGIVLLAGSAKTGEQILLWQGRQIAATLSRPNKLLIRLLRIDPARSQKKAIARIKAITSDVVRIQGRKTNARWLREFLAYDPEPDLARIDVPVLAITGGRDIQVDPDDLDRMRTLVRGPIDVLRPEGVTHLMRAEGARPGLADYRNQVRRPVDRRVVDAVADWLGALGAA